MSSTTCVWHTIMYNPSYPKKLREYSQLGDTEYPFQPWNEMVSRLNSAHTFLNQIEKCKGWQPIMKLDSISCVKHKIFLHSRLQQTCHMILENMKNHLVLMIQRKRKIIVYNCSLVHFVMVKIILKENGNNRFIDKNIQTFFNIFKYNSRIMWIETILLFIKQFLFGLIKFW